MAPLLVLVMMVVVLERPGEAQLVFGGRRCGLTEATCADGSCVDARYVCDGRRDCPDGSDELRCVEEGKCQPNEMQCANGKCVMKHWRCDGDDDCGDNSDEVNCRRPPGSRCGPTEFQCGNSTSGSPQCVPKTFQCDGQSDCDAGYDEFGCADPVIAEQPPAVLIVNPGDVFVIRCRAVGTPIPEISWRRNWNNVPEKCRQESYDGRGTLTCPDAAPADQGAYSCEAINIRGSVFAVPDTNVVVTSGGICQPPEFNSAALTNADCQRCFCFGSTDECASSTLFVSEIPSPEALSVNLVSVETFRSPWTVTRLRERPYPGNAGDILLRPYQTYDSRLYFSLPESHTGRQLNSYGGYLRFQLSPPPPADNTPEVIIQGNGLTIAYQSDVKPRGGAYTIQLTEGAFFVAPRSRRDRVASREQIMMVLENIDYFLIRAPASDRSQTVTLSGLRLDTASTRPGPLGPASLVEQCRCPPGYTGLSCQDCAPGYTRVPGQWLGTCERRLEPLEEECPSGQYGDLRRGIPCRPCPCPGPDAQFGRTCFLESDDQVTCNCDPGYTGRRCDECAPGFRGQPLRGEPCVRGGECDPAGSLQDDPDPRTGQCQCKEFVTGRRCDRCVRQAFYLSRNNPHGCINCFCMGVTDQCVSSDWNRQQVSAVFIGGDQEVALVNANLDYIEDGNGDVVEPTVDSRSRQLVLKDLDSKDFDNLELEIETVYWSLPVRFLGNKVTAYGGSLRLTRSFSAPPGAASYPEGFRDVEIMGNDIRLSHVAESGFPANQPVGLEVPLLERAWLRDDGGPVDREHLLMALADLDYVIVKAAGTVGATQITLSNVEMDIAVPRSTGQERAFAVEQCTCPQGYRGLSCEDCNVGYTRSLSGLYLRQCVLCDCGGRSDECDPETGECLNCRENTGGPFCDECLPGYVGDPSRGRPCVPGELLTCDCNREGSRSLECDDRQRCDCKALVRGDRCDLCQPGSFGLGSHPERGCTRCFCSGVSDQCSLADLYGSWIPMQVLGPDHGFSLATSDGNTVVESNAVDFSAAENEVIYTQTTGGPALYWSLPDLFTGDQTRSYGGELQARHQVNLPFDGRGGGQDSPYVIIIGSRAQVASRMGTYVPSDGSTRDVSVRLVPELWVDRQTGQVATRHLLMTALSDVTAVLIRATEAFSAGPLETRLSNVLLATAISAPRFYDPTAYREASAVTVEHCNCPAEYQGLSCQNCAPGHYRAADFTCQRCPCSGHEESCALADDGSVQCNCRPNYSGRQCQIEGDQPAQPSSAPRVTVSPGYLNLRPGQLAQLECRAEGSPAPTFRWTLNGRDIRDPAVVMVGGLLLISAVQSRHQAEYTCTATNAAGADSVRAAIYVSGDVIEPPPRPTPTRAPEPSRSLVSARTTTLDTGDTLRLKCRSARPDADVIWSRRDLGPLSSRASQLDGDLTIQDVEQGDEGVYVCTMTGPDDYREELEADVVVRVVPPLPTLSIEPQRLTARQGQRVELKCLSSGGLVLTGVRWMRPGGELPVGARLGVSGLIIPAVEPADRGVYVCTADGHGNQASALLEVERQEAPSVLVYPGPLQTVTRGGSLMLQCRVTAGIPTPQLRWSRADGRPLPPTAELVDTGVIRFLRVTGDEEGDYVCTASNDAGETSEVVSVNVISPPVITLDQPELYRVKEGERVELTCSASGDPVPTSVFWEQDARFDGVSGVPGRVTGVFESVAPQDGGGFTCRAESAAGKAIRRLRMVVEPKGAVYDGRQPRGFGQLLRGVGVVEPPQLELYPAASQRVARGGSALVQCRVSAGIPTPQVSWVRADGAPLPPTAELMEDHAAIRFTRVTGEEEGNYTCTAENVAGNASATASIDVLFPPVVTVDQPQLYRVREGSPVELRCSARGDPVPAVVWEAPGRQLSGAARPGSATVLLQPAAPRHAGVYTCRAENEAGRDTLAMRLVVESTADGWYRPARDAGADPAADDATDL